MKRTTIGLDIAKRVFQAQPSIRASGEVSRHKACSAARCCGGTSRSCVRRSSRWEMRQRAALSREIRKLGHEEWGHLHLSCSPLREDEQGTMPPMPRRSGPASMPQQPKCDSVAVKGLRSSKQCSRCTNSKPGCREPHPPRDQPAPPSNWTSSEWNCREVRGGDTMLTQGLLRWTRRGSWCKRCCNATSLSADGNPQSDRADHCSRRPHSEWMRAAGRL